MRRFYDKKYFIHDLPRAKRYVFKLLGQRDYSAGGIEDKLKKRGYPPLLISQAVQFFKAYGFVDDKRFAYAYAKSRILYRPRGRRLLDIELQRKGIRDKELREEVLGKTYADSTEKELIEKIVKKRYKKGLKDSKEFARAYRFLARRGFSLDNINSVLREKR